MLNIKDISANRYLEFSTKSFINTEFSNAVVSTASFFVFSYRHLNTAFCFLLSFEIWLLPQA